MGWAVHSRNTAHYVLASEVNDTYRAPQDLVSLWDPATDIADAWRLVEKMESMDKGSIVYGHYYTELSESSFYTLTAPMAAHTITLAALRAVGVREEEMP